MEVRNCLTLKASPLNSRGCNAPSERSNRFNIDPEGVARVHGRSSYIAALGHSFRVLFPLLPLPPVGCNDLRLLSGDASCVFCATQIIRVGNFNFIIR